jgi:hypothetical protein
MDDRDRPDDLPGPAPEPDAETPVAVGDEPLEAEPTAAGGGFERAAVDVPLVRPESSDLGAPDWRRWRLYGCAAAFLGLVAVLVLGANILRNTVWLGYGATHQRVVAALGEASPPERMRTIRNLDAFTERLRAMDEPYGLMGEFQRRAGEALADGRLEREELDALNDFLERPDGTDAP